MKDPEAFVNELPPAHAWEGPDFYNLPRKTEFSWDSRPWEGETVKTGTVHTI